MKSSTNFDFFGIDKLGPIFLTETANSDKLKSRENSTLEFKESFNWSNKAEYARTIAAFANAKGGYLVFGVTNSPRKLKGLASDKFETLDTAKITEFFNEYFHPEIAWEITTYVFQEKIFGIIYVKESDNKPIICAKSNSPTLIEGSIYYRYRGRTQLIKFSELKEILYEQRKSDQESILKHLKKVTEIGVRNAAVLNSTSGLVEGPGGSFLIDESILPKIQFIKEGHFSETNSAPALKIVGKVEIVSGSPIQPIKKIVTTKALRSTDIVETFFDDEKVPNPIEFIKQICFETSANFPLYYYIKMSKLSTIEIISQLESLNIRNQSKLKLLERLKKEESFLIKHDGGNSTAFSERDVFIKKIKEKIDIDVPKNENSLKRLLQAIRTFKKNEVDKKFILSLAKQIFESTYSSAKSSIATEIRFAICHLDLIYNKT